MPLGLDDQLDEAERMVRDTAEAYAQDKLQPRVTKAYLERGFRPRDPARNGQPRPDRRDHSRRIWRRRPGLCRLRPDRARGRAGRQRLSLGDVGPVEPRDVPDLRLRIGRAEEEISPGPGQGRTGRLLRPDRARCRIRPGRNAHPGEEDRQRLFDQRRQDVDHQFADRRRVRGVGQVRSAWRCDPRLRAGKGHEGPERAQDRRETVACARRSPARS